jgi:hypothetical protein
MKVRQEAPTNSLTSKHRRGSTLSDRSIRLYRRAALTAPSVLFSVKLQFVASESNPLISIASTFGKSAAKLARGIKEISVVQHEKVSHLDDFVIRNLRLIFEIIRIFSPP